MLPFEDVKFSIYGIQFCIKETVFFLPDTTISDSSCRNPKQSHLHTLHPQPINNRSITILAAAIDGVVLFSFHQRGN
jgi:hypothetical protein